MDRGYDYEAVRALAEEYSFTLHLPRRGESDKPLEVGKKARRWVVERPQGWIQQVPSPAGALGEA